MQAAIIITNGSTILAKCTYAGDISTPTMNAEVSRLQSKYPTFTVTLFATDQDSTFVNATSVGSLPN